MPIAQWFTPPRMLALARLLFGVAALLCLCIAYRLVVRLEFFTLRGVEVSGEMSSVPEIDLARAVQALRGNFLTLDLDVARDMIEAVAWVRKARLERIFPDRLGIRIEQHRALAHWYKGGLINRFGEPFEAHYKGPLPVFEGAPERAADMAQRYSVFKSRLAPLGLEPVVLALTPRQAWRLQLDNGLKLELGREEIDARLKTFVDAYGTSIAPFRHNSEYVDMRYPNGFALKLRSGAGARRPAGRAGNG